MKNQFDERQIQIRGQVFFHGLIMALALVLINGFLQANSITWANGFDQNLLIVIATVMVVSIEAILRDAFFEQQRMHWLMIGIYGVCAVTILIFYAIRFLQGDSFMENGGLSNYGSNFTTGLLLAIATIVGICKELSERRKRSE
jgi:hypothetical protein